MLEMRYVFGLLFIAAYCGIQFGIWRKSVQAGFWMAGILVFIVWTLRWINPHG